MDVAADVVGSGALLERGGHPQIHLAPEHIFEVALQIDELQQVGRNRQIPTDSQRGGEQAGGHEDRSRGGIRQRGDLNEPIGLELDIEGEAPEKIGACKGRGRLRDDDLVCLLFEDGIAEIRGNRL